MRLPLEIVLRKRRCGLTWIKTRHRKPRDIPGRFGRALL
jgi:hypothetical protein